MMNNEKEKDAIDTSKLDEILPKYDPLKLNSINLAQNYVSAFNTGMNIYQCVNQLQGYIEWVVKAVNDVVKSWNVQVGESIDQSKAIVRETTTEQFNTEWTNKQPELIEQVNTLTTNQFNEDWGVLENRINTTLENQNTNIQNIQTQQNNLASNQTNLANRMDTFTSLSEGSTTGDAELKDIRVGANGVTYPNAGDAVRGQYSQLKEDLDDVINKKENLWKNGDVTKSYIANAQYQNMYYDIELEDGDYYFQFDSVSGAVDGSVKIFPYAKDTDIIASIRTDTKHGTFSPFNGGIRIYFFATSNTVATEAGTAVWSGIKLVKGISIETTIKESALPEFYQTLPTVIPQIEEDSKKLSLFDDIATVVETENLWKNGDVEIPYSQGQIWISKIYNIPLTEGEKYTLKFDSASGYAENAGGAQIFPYGESTGIITSVKVGKEKTFVSPKTGVTIFFFASGGTPASNSGIAKWSGIELQKGEGIKPNREVTINYDVLPDIVKSNKIAEDFEITSDTFSSGNSLSLVVSNSKSRNQIGFDATIDSMGTITIYYGNTMAFNDCKVVINSTEVVSYICTQAWVEKARGNHGLTLAHHITVRIANGNNKTAIISITDETGTVYELETNWACGHGDIVVENQSGSYSKCKLTFYPSEYKEKVWAYGDSYFDLWPWICNEKGAKSWMIDGFSGRGSADALKSLKIALKKSTPSIVLWCMGMNDPDSTSAINSTWLDTLNEVKTICDEKQITLIPTTIPNVPTRNHSFKNTYIRENFDRYVDISESLGAEVSTSWYNGLLPDGDIHPSDKGRMLIAQKIMSEVPEIM